ncbi:portal protein [Caulobacter sp. X]|uniref:portal protein n=1 Tax=Caulobacter sp. X TaxID=2048901 RepID=UPI000C1489FE|nr:portal protein [Caulobacter sp. X]PIB96507.1 hypothetical protein CSW60_18540 [Caulobacter sp. X]
MAAEWKAIRRNFEHLQSLRSIRDAEMQQVADVFMPRKSFICTPVPGQLRPRMVTSSKPIAIFNKSHAMLAGFLFDPTRPNVNPNTARGLIQAGRRSELDAESADYITNLSWQVHDRMMLPAARFLATLARVCQELVGFGTAVAWVGRQRGFGPVYMARPLRSCWIAENDEGVVDTLYFRWSMPAWKVVTKYPKAAEIQKIKELAEDPQRWQTPITLLHAVEPRQGGVMRGVATNMPFASVVIAVDYDEAVLEESGFNSFPFAVPRLGVEEGSAYGTGLAWRGLPTALVMNELQRGIEKAVSGRVDPPMFAPARFLSKALDRRPGAVNYYDETGLGFQNLRDAIQYMQQGGDVGIGVEYMNMLAGDLDEVFLTDGLKLRDNGDVTAEEIIERRQRLIRSMVAYVPNVDRDLMSVTADRTLTILGEEDMIAPPPEQLSEIDVDWDYAGPLAIAQQQGQVDTFRQLLNLAGQAANIDPSSTAVLALEEGLRACAEALAAPAGMLRSRVEVEQLRQQQAEAAQAEREAALAAQAGAAFRDAAQGANTLAAADQMQRGEARAA